MSEEPLNKHEWRVETIPLSTCQEMVKLYHYAKGGSNTATYRHGLIRNLDNSVMGVAWWIPPTMSAARATYPQNPSKVLSLSRLVCHPNVPKNGASFLIGKSIKLIREEKKWECLVTYADTYQNHDGKIYRATNWEYMGKTTPESIWIDNTGRMIARKAGPKTRTKHEMENLGYKMIGRFSKHKYRMILIGGRHHNG